MSILIPNPSYSFYFFPKKIVFLWNKFLRIYQRVKNILCIINNANIQFLLMLGIIILERFLKSINFSFVPICGKISFGLFLFKVWITLALTMSNYDRHIKPIINEYADGEMIGFLVALVTICSTIRYNIPLFLQRNTRRNPFSQNSQTKENSLNKNH